MATQTRRGGAVTSLNQNPKKLVSRPVPADKKVVVPVLSPDYNPAEDDMDNFIVRYDEIGTLTAERNGTTTTFSGTLSKKPDEDLPISLVYPKFPFDFRGQKGTLTDISANFDHAVGVLEKWTLDGDNITVPDTIVTASELDNPFFFNFFTIG